MDPCALKLSVTALSFGGALAVLTTLFAGIAAGQPRRDAGEVSTPVIGAEPRPGRVKLAYELGPGARGCDDEAFFRRMLRSELEIPDPFEPTGPATHALTVRIERDAPGFRAIVKLHTTAGQEVYARDFLERTCADAVDRAVIVAMLAVFPAAEDTPLPPPGPERSDSAPAPAAGEGSDLIQRVAALEARVAAQERTIQRLINELELRENKLRHEEKGTKKKMDIAWALSAGALMTANLTPDVAPGVWVEGAARTGPFSLSADLRAALPSSAPYGRTHSFDLTELTGFLVPCGHFLYFSGCALIGLGVDIAYDGDLKSPASANAVKTGFLPVYQAGGRIGVDVPFGDSMFGAKAWADLLYTWPETTIVYNEDDSTGWLRPAVNAAFGLGLFIKLGGDGAE